MGVSSSKVPDKTTKMIIKKRQIAIAEEVLPWSDLPPELVYFVVKPLSSIDRFNVNYVFPNWGSVMSMIPSVPFMVHISNKNWSCARFKFVDYESKTGFTIKRSELPCNVSLLSSNYGWLLFSNYGLSYVFFYNPLSMDIIQLPPINLPLHSSVCFSAPPTSPECMVFCAQYGHDTIRILFCCRGSEKWTKLYFDQKNTNYMPLSSYNAHPIFHRGKVNWLKDDGRLRVFDPLDQSWDIHGNADLHHSRTSNLLVQSGDDIFAIDACNVNYDPSIRVYKLDYIGNKWKETNTLDGRCFYISFYPSITFSKEASPGEENKIYLYPFNGRCFVYDVCLGRLLNQRNISYLRRTSVEYCCWIEPKWDRPSCKELVWF